VRGTEKEKTRTCIQRIRGSEKGSIGFGSLKGKKKVNEEEKVVRRPLEKGEKVHRLWR